jgi:hypothetical protein
MRLFDYKDPFYFEPLSEEEQERVSLGHQAQLAVVADFKRRLPHSKCTYMAPTSSQKTDIIMQTGDGVSVKIEAKSVKAMVTVFDTTVRRGDRNEILDWIAKRVLVNKSGLSFADLIDQEREKDKSIGFAGDRGAAPNSGKVPAWWISSPSVLAKLRDILHQRYAAKNDNYLAIVNAAGQVSYHYVAGPKIPQIQAQPFPTILKAKTDTYGRSQPGSVRAAVKVRFAP